MFNADKTKYMIFSYRELLHLTNIKIGSATIEETNNIKFLGIIFNKRHTFKHHADVIARKISKSVGILFKLPKYLPLEIIKTLYYSLMNPFLLYGIEVWHGTYANTTNKIFILHKKACWAIHNLHINTHTTEYFKNAKILKLTDLMNRKSLNICSYVSILMRIFYRIVLVFRITLQRTIINS